MGGRGFTGRKLLTLCSGATKKRYISQTNAGGWGKLAKKRGKKKKKGGGANSWG